MPQRERETREQKVLAAKAYVSYAEKELLGGTEEEEWVEGNRKTFPIFALTETGLLRSPRFIKEPTRKRERGKTEILLSSLWKTILSSFLLHGRTKSESPRRPA